ncbi:ureidoglycolate lyase [Eoetvoesiella caeni]|uniref:Ureidoglycolate lyase n=1 Tax=Eoetvoesiella caeni TaxID=645616 RepID=A0A366HG25_9BURK|nr:ureidoglycolate lyase [Eoetvoesiella caeni]MCI2808402.1 ureidoglycolate lyase [Eoetvoesiella caeni]NYT54943.1 ureidoglycolate lyase [Eoetvoesiella caeni]RBP41084.1 ureidoglycolate lyase [Eoetvoesiella caeni]
MPILKLERLTQSAFAGFGDVIEMNDRDWFHINNGSTRRYHNQSTVQVTGADGQAGISLARGDAFKLPQTVTMLERHPLGSQSWIPMDGAPFLIVVAPNGVDGLPDEAGIRAFYADGGQGVNYFQGTWHHPLMTLGRQGSFVVIDRIGSVPNCDERDLAQHYTIDGAFKDKAVPPLVSM